MWLNNMVKIYRKEKSKKIYSIFPLPLNNRIDQGYFLISGWIEIIHYSMGNAETDEAS